MHQKKATMNVSALHDRRRNERQRHDRRRSENRPGNDQHGKPKGWFQVFRNLAGSAKDGRKSTVSKAISDYFDKHYMANPLMIVEEGKNCKIYLNPAKSR